MDDLQTKIKADKDQKKKRLEELKAAKAAREESKKREEKTGTKPLELAESPESPSMPVISYPQLAEETIQLKKPILTAYTHSLSCNPRPKLLKYEREIQVQIDLPKPSPTEVSKEHESDPVPEIETRPRHHSLIYSTTASPAKDPGEPFKRQGEGRPINFEQIFASPDFTDFYSKSIRLVERALEQEFDVCETFHGHDQGAAADTHSRLKHLYDLKDEDYNTRCIGTLQWSPTNEELFLATYSLTGFDTGEHTHGLAKIWVLSQREKPTFSLCCQSMVTAATFNEFEANMVFGGLYSGQLVVWDLRAKSAPVQRTSLVQQAHNQPVVAICISGSQNINSIVSLSSDGHICTWSLNMLHLPTFNTDIKQNAKETACTCLAFPGPEMDRFYVGMEDGNIAKSRLKPSKGEDIGVEVINAHTGPVTALDIHENGEFEGLSGSAGGLLLSSSVDWTVKLWQPESQSTPLFSLESYEDYVYSVRWSPANPSLFAVGDGDGNLDVWDVFSSTESPIFRQKVNDAAVNQIAWSARGQRLAAGSSKGEISLFQLEQEYAQSKASDWTHLEQMFSVSR